SVQVHDTPVERAEAGQRVAVNLPQVERRELGRGDVLVTPGRYRNSFRLDIRLTEIEPVPAAITVHIGTQSAPARIVRDGEYAQLRLAHPVVAARGDRVVLRTDTTVGGGIVLDRARLEQIESGDTIALVHEPVAREELLARGIFEPAALDTLPSAGGFVFS